MIEGEMSQQPSRTNDCQRHAKWARICAIAIFAISVAYVSMLPSGGISSMSYDSFRYLAGTEFYPCIRNLPGYIGRSTVNQAARHIDPLRSWS